MIRITTLDYYLDEEEILNSSMNGIETLLDTDLLIANPLGCNYLWKKYLRNSADDSLWLNSPKSDEIRKILKLRKNETTTLLENGKVIVCFIHPIELINAEIGNSRDYETFTNYDFLPIDVEFFIRHLACGAGNSNSIKLISNNLFSPFFSAFKNELEYKAYLDVNITSQDQLFLVNHSNKPVGFLLNVHNGIIAFLPTITNKNSKKIISVLTSIAKKHLKHKTKTPTPSWVNDYHLKGESELQNKIYELQNKIQKVELERNLLIEELDSITSFKALLYEQGSELEEIVIKSFKLFGFNAENLKKDDIEHDIVFESEEGRGIAEIEGKDNDAINVSKFDQLNRAVDEEFYSTGNYPQGILIGNHFRLTNPVQRKEPFTDKVMIIAKKKSFGLLTTSEIFKAVQKVIENPENEELRKKIRTQILNSEGTLIELD